MVASSAARATPVEVAAEPLLDDDGYDHADAFAIHIGRADDHSAEWWARTGLERAPALVRWVIVAAQRGALRLRLDTRNRDRVLGWQIRSRTHDAIALEAAGPVLRGVVVVRRTEPTVAVIKSFVFFRRRMVARIVWAVALPIHRRLARYLLENAATLAADGRTYGATPEAPSVE
jgi:hypothetical protein